VLIGVLNGSVVFLSDLVRCMPVPVELDFLALSSFAPDSGRLRIMKDIGTDVRGRDVVLVEDVIDTGLSVTFLADELRRREPASVEVCTLLDKRARRVVPVPLDHVGFEVPDVFVLGYGLDYEGRYRNLPALWSGDLGALVGDPDVYVEQLYDTPNPR
jgi:hypoxanthine phosphoribosyltransferase